MSKIKTSITIDEEVVNAIKEIAEKEDRNFSQQVNKILKDYLKDRAK